MKTRRAFYRHPYHYPVKIIEDHHSASIQSLDMSLGGICIAYEKSFERGQDVRIEIPLSKRTFKLSGKVCYSVKKGSGSHYRIGIAFSDQSSVFMAKMAEEILCIQKVQTRMSVKEKQYVDETTAAQVWIEKHATRFATFFEE